MTAPIPAEKPGSIKPWDSDHTALVHVLWDAQHDGLIPKGRYRGDAIADVLASRIMQSQWHRAVKEHTAAEVAAARDLAQLDATRYRGEAERLRAALERIAALPAPTFQADGPTWRDVAREALTGGDS